MTRYEHTVAPLDPLTWRRLIPYLDQALDLEPAQLESWLAELASKDTSIADQVRQLLAERDALNSQRFLFDSPLSETEFTVATEATMAGKQIGGYTIERRIGSGGMGEVWLASRSDGLFEGHCAIKFVHGATGRPQLAERFHREGRLLARLTHPNIGRLIDAGTTNDGRQFLLLEYVDGERIDRYCDAKSLSIDARIKLFLDVVSAVAHAHSHLIIHRDLKPSNVWVTHDGTIKLLDFGIAKLLSDDVLSSDASATQVGEVALTPEYAAPEQLLGDMPSTATDVYQLGMLLYVLLTGSHPLQRVAHRADRIKLALEGTLPSASEVASGPARKLLRGDLDAILATAMRKDPKERYPTAAGMRDDLVRYLNHEPVIARRGAALYLARKLIYRHWRGALAITLVAIAFLAAFVVTTLQLTEARRQRELALASAQRAEASKDFFALMLSEFQLRGEPLTTKSLIERSSTLLKTQYADRPAFVAEMLIDLAHEALNMGELQTTLSLLTNARDIAIAQANHSLLAESECIIARARLRQGDEAEAQKHLASGLTALARLPAEEVNLRAVCMRAQATIFAKSGNREEAIRIERRARAMLESAGADRNPEYVGVLSALGTDLMDAGQVSEALPVYQLAADSQARTGFGGTRAQLLAQQNVVSALYRLGEVREAYHLARDIENKLLQLNSAEDLSAISIVNLAIGADRLALRDPVEDLLPSAIARTEKEGDAYVFRLASVALARMRLRMGLPRADVESPLKHLESARINGKPVIDPPGRVLVESALAELDLREGQWQAADRRATSLLQYLTDLNVHRPRSNYLALWLASKTALAAGDPARAIAHARAALQIVEPIARASDTSADVGDALLVMGKAMLMQKKPAEARAVLLRAARCLRNGYGPDHPATREAQRLSAS